MKKLIYTLAIILIVNCTSTIKDCDAQSKFQLAIGGTGSDFAYSIVQTTDGGYVVAGMTNSFGAGDYDMYIVKINNIGTLQWNITVGGTGADIARSIIQQTDGSYEIAGYTNSYGIGYNDMYIVRLNSGGGLQWKRTVGGTDFDWAYSIIKGATGGYAVAGYTSSFGAGGSDMFIVKLDASFTKDWSRTVGWTGDEAAFTIVQTTDGGYIMAGGTNSFGAGFTDMNIVKLDASGIPQWGKTVGGTSYDVANSIVQTTDGGYVVAGRTNSFGAGNDDMYIVKLSSSGTLLWSRTVGGTGQDYANSIVQTTDGGYIVAGSTTSFGAGNSDMYIVKLNASGNTCGNTTSPTSISSNSGLLGFSTTNNTEPLSQINTPASLTGSGGTVTTFCLTEIQPISNEIPSSYSLSQNYPNPFNPMTKIRFDIPKNDFVKLMIYDILGKEVMCLSDGKLNAGSYEASFNASNLPSGIYICRLISGDYVASKKMLLIK